VLKDAAVEPFAGNESKFVKGLNLWKVKEEDPNDSELGVLEKWAGAHCTSSARSTIESSEDATVIIEADKCDHIGHDGTEVLGPLQTKGGISFEMKNGKFHLVDPETGVALSATRIKVLRDADELPTMVWMHDECMCRHKDIGRYGWSHRKMASQRFKDDGSGRMMSSFISDLFGMLWVDENDMQKVNAKRARENKLPISFGVICSLEGENLDPDYSAHLDLELQMLNAERLSRGEAPGTS